MNKAVKYLLDTNVISDFMYKDKNVVNNMDIAMANENQIYVCSIVYYEIVRGLKSAQKFNRLKEFYTFYKSLSPLYFDRENMNTVEKSIDIYDQLHKGQQIEDNDIFIAATAIVNDCILVTANIKHFGRIEGLKLVNWRDETPKIFGEEFL